MIDIPLPRLIDDNGKTIREVRPISVSLNLDIIPLSYASLELPRNESLPARGYVELYSSMGSAGIYRVRSPQDAYGEDITTAELEHAIVEVGDFLVLAEYNKMMDAKAAMTAVFSHYRGSKWQLGSIDVLEGKTIALQAKYVRVLEAMLSILDQCRNCMMAFDFSTTPWTVSIVSRGTSVAAEGRLSRNVNSAKVIYDDTELCTRVYYEVPSKTDSIDTKNYPQFNKNTNYSNGSILSNSEKLYQLTNAHKSGVAWEDTSKKIINDSPSTSWKYLDADTMSKYGLIERNISTGNDYTTAECDTVARDYLERNKEPRVSVEISAEELSSITGEPFDTFTIGKMCRLALVDFGVTVERVITGLTWNNVYGDPFNITVLLSDDEYTAITFLHDIDSKGGSGGGGGGGGQSQKAKEKEFKEFYTLLNRDDKHIELMAIRQDRSERILQQAGLYIDSEGLIQYARDNENMLASHLQVQADKIESVVEDIASSGYSSITQMATSINARVGDAEGDISQILIDLNGIYISGTKISIAGNEIDLDGYVKVADLNATNAEIQNLISGNTTAQTLRSYAVACSSFYLNGYTVSWRQKTVVTSIDYTAPSLGMSSTNDFMNSSGNYISGRLVTSWSDGEVSPNRETINYLG